MSFLNPWVLLGALGIGLPILAHLLNRYQVKRTDWAAMRFLNRSVRIRSRQIKLKDILLLILRCLALLLVVLALSRPATETANGALARLGERRAGVVIALDASFSMLHRAGDSTRFDKALEKIETITAEMRPGDPVTLVILGAEHRAVVRNIVFDPAAFHQLLEAQQVTDEALDMDSLPRRLKDFAVELKAPQKEVYIITDLQEQDWTSLSAWLHESFKELASQASVFVVPVESRPDNLAITELELVSGVLRQDTSARYRATVRNCGPTVAEQVKVTGLVNNISADVKVIPAIAPNTSETVSLFIPFRDAGPVRITARLDDDALAVDNTRRAVAVIRDRVSVLCVEGSDEQRDRSGALIAAALRAGSQPTGRDGLDVQSVTWLDLPGQDLSNFDVVILADVPDITPEQARLLERYVREGNGLIWFGGDHVKADVWNQRSALEGIPLLPAVIENAMRTSDAMGVGRPLDPSLTDHPVCRPLLSLPEDLLSETRFHKLLKVNPAPTSMSILTLAGSDDPVLLGHALGRGQVFMFTTSAGPGWNNLAVTPVFPMLLQQMVTYLTAREFEMPRLVGESLSLSYADQPDATEAVFDTPSGETITVPVQEYRDQYVALLENAREAGFYLARVSLQAAGLPIAVNVDTRESDIRCLTAPEAAGRLEGTGVRVVGSDAELLAGLEESRASTSWWRAFLLAGLALLIIESLFAEWLLVRGSRTGRTSQANETP